MYSINIRNHVRAFIYTLIGYLKGGRKVKTYHERSVESTMRGGWTLIELILIIVVIGILAAIAIKKLTITRDDAKLSSDVANMNVCIKDIANLYTATHTNLEDINASSCDRVVCYTIDRNQTTLNVTLNSTAANYCADVQYVGGHLAHKYELAGKIIQR